MVKESYLMVDALTQKDNLFTRMDARIKVIMSIAVFIAVIGISGFKFSGGIFILALAAIVLIRTPFKVIIGRIAGPFVLGLIVLSLLIFLQGSHQLFAIDFGGFKLVGYREGFLMGATIFARIAACVTVLLLLSVTTPVHELGYALIWMKVPTVIVEILLLTYRYLFVLWDEGMRIRQAQTLRLGYPNVKKVDGWKQSVKSTSTLMGMVFIRAYDRAESTYSAMQLRAYNGDISSKNYKNWNKTQTNLLVSGLLILLVLAAVSI